MSIRVVTDSTFDLSRAEIEQHGITIIPLYVNIDGQSYRDGVDLQRDEFYARLSGCDGQMSTSAPGPGVFVETYRRLADEGATSIISLHLSSELSNVCQVAQMAAQEACKKAQEYGVRSAFAYIKGPGSGRESALRAINASGIRITGIKDVTPVPHNGWRPPEKRRV